MPSTPSARPLTTLRPDWLPRLPQTHWPRGDPRAEGFRVPTIDNVVAAVRCRGAPAAEQERRPVAALCQQRGVLGVTEASLQTKRRTAQRSLSR